MLLDVLLAANITLAILILMVSMYLTNPLEISVFPGLLLILTMFRLGLNVASTRLILGEGYAGEVITAFGSFVVKGNYVVGFIIFLILVLIQFVVIVKGAGRISEVAARFTLDGMPGKQMAIDADMNAGMITEKEARQRRAEISREAEFYGAMDGASKFVNGDAIAGLLINIVNILGGFIIGVAQKGMSFTDALQTYTLLTVGDGLVTQIPALIVAVSSGMIVTRSAAGNAFDLEIRIADLRPSEGVADRRGGPVAVRGRAGPSDDSLPRAFDGFRQCRVREDARPEDRGQARRSLPRPLPLQKRSAWRTIFRWIRWSWRSATV